MAILQLVDQLAAMLQQGRDVPLSRYRMVDAEEFGKLLERIRISVPSSIRESERTLSERDNILATAQAEAERLVQQAKEHAMDLAREESVVAMAQQESARILEESHRLAQKRIQEADEYAIHVLRDLSQKLKSVTQQVDNGVEVMQLRPSPQSSTAIIELSSEQDASPESPNSESVDETSRSSTRNRHQEWTSPA